MNEGCEKEIRTFLAWAARQSGFARVGFCNCDPMPERNAALSAWLDLGGRRFFPYKDDPKLLNPGQISPFEAKTAMVAFFPYFRPDARPGQAPGSLKLARYAWGPDYHGLLKEKLKAILVEAQGKWSDLQGHVCVDTAPLMEKALAVRAGLGFQGKNTLLILKPEKGCGGSFGVLGVLLLNKALEVDAAFGKNYCGTCQRCIDACPSKALTPWQLNPSKCLSTYNLEWEGEAPEGVENALRSSRWAAGCDICQEACPWNKKALEGDAELWGSGSPLHVLPIEELSCGTARFRKWVEGRALRRIKHRHWLLTIKRVTGK